MHFRLFSNAFLHLPTVIEDGEARYTKTIPTKINHDDGRTITPGDPLDKDFPSDLPLDCISRTWKPLDDEARAALAKLSPMGKTERPPVAAAPLSAEDLLAAIAKLSDGEAAKIRASLAPAPAGKAK